MWDETSPDRRKRNGSPRACDEAYFQDVPMGEVQDEYDHDDGHGAYRCCGPRNGPVDGIRHSQQILLRTNAISPNYPLLASRKIHLRVQRPSPTPVPWLLFLLTTPVYFYSGWIFLYSSFRASPTKNAEHVSPHCNGHNRGIQLQRSPHYCGDGIESASSGGSSKVAYSLRAIIRESRNPPFL